MVDGQTDKEIFFQNSKYTLLLISYNLDWTCLLISLKYMENQEQSGQVQLRLEN
jgi:hypothetical protein